MSESKEISKKKYAGIWSRVQAIFLLGPRDMRCMTASATFHLLIILILAIAVTPAAGRPDSDFVNVSFSPELPGSKDEKSDSALPKSNEEVDPFWEEPTKENLQALKDSFNMEDDGEAKEYIQQRRQNITEKKKRILEYSKQQEKISSSLGQRSRYGTLKPRTFYGVYLFAKKMVFTLDVSGSMDLRESKIQLKNAYYALGHQEYFNIVVYSDSITSWKPALVPATEENKKSADAWLAEINSGGATNIHEALQTAFNIASQTMKAETIYLLSDGLPTAGSVQNPLDILSAVRAWNKTRRIVVHTIGIGPHQDKKFLSALAEQNYGRYYVK